MKFKSPYPKTNHKFYQSTHPLIHHLFHIFIKGDFSLFPLIALILITSLFSFKIMLIFYGIYLAVRYLGEIIYWLLQQFGDKKYRPNDFGLKELDNNAIYIIYQLIAVSWTTIGILIIIISLLYL